MQHSMETVTANGVLRMSVRYQKGCLYKETPHLRLSSSKCEAINFLIYLIPKQVPLRYLLNGFNGRS